MRPISFLSDFGLTDEFVGVVHGVVARIEPELRVIDVTHGIERGNVRAGALALLRAIQYLPEGVALVVVDPGVGTSRRPIAAETAWGHFVGPDNGVLAPAVAMMGGASAIVALEDERFRVPSLGGATFDGRDVFAPAAAVLAAGQAAITDLGPVLEDDSLTPLLLPLVEPEGEGIRGEVWWLDQYGNCQTNVSPEDLEALGVSPGDQVTVQIGGTEYDVPWQVAYGDVEPGEALLHVDSYGLMAVAVREGSAAERLNLTAGHPVTLRKLA
ncbi:MAG: SAM-dependent chlorinase/fluorinase [Acidimicrobiia bacterium]|nr:SAM-dependent chlorinase/fluorinase [Acidimicrobiia bacterium]MBT8192164.1 SAM-dependent chlorinase/fluorinase [Acidimicrobiia bacterium]NNF88753.1 SAM-dependent chlorinase/fluorinase [Acidimicrobiia bacterium]NNL13199.1 SAM-dependent chlorinase/fluorinase [Acidimicrobiia bacterium]NNL98154.1 SAM-dependent chlorinase/fluorinase [Acidimicrobiia bacterium]